MKIIVVGAGEVGFYLSDLLSRDGHEVTVVEQSEHRAEMLDEAVNAKVYLGSGSTAAMIKRAGVEDCDFFMAMTSDDKTNIIACSLAKALGLKVQTVARIHDQTYSDNSIVNYQHHFGIDHVLNPEALCAVELAKAMRNPGRLAVENIARGQIEVQQVQVSERSRYANKTLREIRIEAGVRIGFVRKDKEVMVPTADTTLKPGMWVALFGRPDAVTEERANVDPAHRLTKVRVVLFGATETAIALVRLLDNPRFRVRIIEKDGKLCDTLAQQFDHVTIINGDATTLRILEEEQVDGADYFVACTKDDEDNIMTSLQVSRLGTKHVQLVINRADYQEVINTLKTTLGVELIVSPRLATAHEVMRLISTDDLLELATLGSADTRMVEAKIPDDSKQGNKTLREIPWPPGTVVVALLHKYQAKVPGPEDKILPGDRLVAIVREQNMKELSDLLK